MPPIRSRSKEGSISRRRPLTKRSSNVGLQSSDSQKRPKRPTKDDLKKFAIRFEGPVSPKDWPERYRHHFQVIRDIWANRYDDYDQNRELRKGSYMDKYRQDVKKVVDNAARFRENSGRNELTWRGSIENPVFNLFSNTVRCYCGRELREMEYQAEPFNKNGKEKLKEIRRDRAVCTRGCHQRSTIIVDDYRDEEIGHSVFDTVWSQRVVHIAEDKLGKSGIPMAPDRVFGLRRTEKLAEYMNESHDLDLVHSPITADSLAYPFLVLEAKKGSDSPGFRSIEAQTAFPIRRFLRMQEDLKIVCQADFDPLVWYFANQGEIWQLSAATIQDRKIRVFELWLGNIESEDGALQLLQIIDYIWTWARDIFRHDIYRCLAALPGPVKRSPSLHVDDGPAQQGASAFSQQTPESIQIDRLASPEPPQSGHSDSTLLHTGLQDANSHPFLRWSERRDLSKTWALQSAIRHGDIVMFSFRVFEVPDNFNRLISFILSAGHNAQSITEHLSELMQHDAYTLITKRRDILQMANHWTESESESGRRYKATKGDEVVKAFVFFRSYCRPSDWQIVREVCCIIWTASAVGAFNKHFKTKVNSDFQGSAGKEVPVLNVIEALQQLRGFSGKLSVAFALGNMCLVLRPRENTGDEVVQVDWLPSKRVDRNTVRIAQLTSLCGLCVAENFSRPYRHHSQKLLSVFRNIDQELIPEELSECARLIGHERAVITIKPKGWEDECPRFCLFVFVKEGYDDEQILGSMLRHTIETGALLAVNGQGGQDHVQWTAHDDAIIMAWRDNFSEQEMLA